METIKSTHGIGRTASWGFAARRVYLALVAAIALPAAPSPGQTTHPSSEQLQSRNDQLQAKLDSMQSEVDSLKQEMQQVRQEEMQSLLAQVDAEADAATPDDLQAGYDHGFYIRQGDDFRLNLNALLDTRYTFAHLENPSRLTTTPLGTRYTGNFSGFSLNDLELTFSGEIYKHVNFRIEGNFGSISSYTAPTAGEFALTEAWVGYEFAPEFNIRAGSIIVPLAPLTGLRDSGGLLFPDVPDTYVPFANGYSLGLDFYGRLRHDTISYDVLVSNGVQDQLDVDAAAPGGGTDNRLAVFTREQFAGAGTLADFVDESDLQQHEHLVWVLGGGVGYDSQNPAESLTGGESALGISGLSAAAGPGYAPRYVLNGNDERFLLDFRSKWQGWSTFLSAFAQNIHSEGGAIVPGSTRSTIWQIGWFAESGYFLIPRRLEVAGRVGQIWTVAFPNHMDMFEAGLNYYPFGQAFKVQLAEEYIPSASGVTSGNGTVLNTQDLITEVQLQLRF